MPVQVNELSHNACSAATAASISSTVSIESAFPHAALEIPEMSETPPRCCCVTAKCRSHRSSSSASAELKRERDPCHHTSSSCTGVVTFPDNSSSSLVSQIRYSSAVAPTAWSGGSWPLPAGPSTSEFLRPLDPSFSSGSLAYPLRGVAPPHTVSTLPAEPWRR